MKKIRRVLLYMLYLFQISFIIAKQRTSRLISVSMADLSQSLPQSLWKFLCAFIQDHVNSGNKL